MHVIATTEEGTRRALVEAGRISERIRPSRVVLLVPRIVSFLRPPAGPLEDARIKDQYRDLAEDTGVDATVRVCVCQRPDEAFLWMLRKPSTIVIGGRRRWWWPTPAQQTARYLKDAGHQVVFAAVD